MLKRRIIPCLDVKNGQVVKGVKFLDHEVIGHMLDLAIQYSVQGADELVLYDITASSEERTIDQSWIAAIAQKINIPFCVAGGIRCVADAAKILANGADKISINSPALADPALINALVKRFGSQCVVVGIDSFEKEGEYFVYQYTGDPNKCRDTGLKTLEWVQEVAWRGAGEIVLNSMNQDGVKQGYDIKQLAVIADSVNIPVIASGGAGTMEHFKTLFQHTRVTGALAASVFHKKWLTIPQLKDYLQENQIEVRR